MNFLMLDQPGNNLAFDRLASAMALAGLGFLLGIGLILVLRCIQHAGSVTAEKMEGL